MIAREEGAASRLYHDNHAARRLRLTRAQRTVGAGHDFECVHARPAQDERSGIGKRRCNEQQLCLDGGEEYAHRFSSV